MIDVLGLLSWHFIDKCLDELDLSEIIRTPLASTQGEDLSRHPYAQYRDQTVYHLLVARRPTQRAKSAWQVRWLSKQRGLDEAT